MKRITVKTQWHNVFWHWGFISLIFYLYGWQAACLAVLSNFKITLEK